MVGISTESVLFQGFFHVCFLVQWWASQLITLELTFPICKKRFLLILNPSLIFFGTGTLSAPIIENWDHVFAALYITIVIKGV